MPNVSVITKTIKTNIYIPDFDDKIYQEYQLATMHKMGKLGDKLIVHENADQTMESILDGLFTSPQDNHYNSDRVLCLQSGIRR